MIKTTWTCDKCGAVSETHEDMWVLAVSLKRCRGTGVGPYHQPSLGPSAEWCQKCIELAGLVLPTPPPKHPVAPTTLEDLVREIVTEEMEGTGP